MEKNGNNLREIERVTGTSIKFKKEERKFSIFKYNGDLFGACEMIERILSEDEREKEYSDWEKYCYWWYFYNIEKKNIK